MKTFGKTQVKIQIVLLWLYTKPLKGLIIISDFSKQNCNFKSVTALELCTSEALKMMANFALRELNLLLPWREWSNPSLTSWTLRIIPVQRGGKKSLVLITYANTQTFLSISLSLQNTHMGMTPVLLYMLFYRDIDFHQCAFHTTDRLIPLYLSISTEHKLILYECALVIDMWKHVNMWSGLSLSRHKIL